MKYMFTIMLFLFTSLSVFSQKDEFLLDDSLVIMLQNNNKPDTKRADALSKVIEVLIDNRQYHKAQSYINEIVELSDKLNDNYLKALGDYYSGVIFVTQNNFPEAFRYIFESKNIVSTLNKNEKNLKLTINIINSLGGYYYKCNMLPEAYECFQFGIELNKKLNDDDFNIKLLNNMVIIYSALGKHSEAIEISKENLNKTTDPKLKNNFTIYLHIAYNYVSLHEYDSAYRYLDIASRYTVTNDDNAKILIKRGDISYNNEDNFNAIKWYSECINIDKFEEFGIKEAALIRLGLSYSKISKNDTALMLIDKAIEESRLKEMLSLEVYGLSKKNMILYELGLYKEYSDNVQQYILLSDSLNNKVDEERLNQMILQRQFKEIEAKYQYNQMLLDKQNRQKVIVFTFILITLLFVIILILLLLNRKKILLEDEKIKEEALTKDLEFRNRELASNVLSLMKKNEMFTDIVNRLLTICDKTENLDTKDAIMRITKDIEKTIEGKFLEEFEIRFKQVHSDFYENLLTKYPDLTSNEIRLCSFLKLNLSTKDISSITGQSVRSIEKARERLRKKLGISANFSENLSSFVSKI